MNDGDVKLIEVLNDRSPILLLGAGFSLGGITGKGLPIPSSEQLSQELFDKVLAKADISAVEMDELRADRNNLQKVCDYISQEHLVAARNAYLVERLSGCHCSRDSFHMVLKDYQWSYIFTLNIDDLVESIFNYDRNAISVQINGKLPAIRKNLPQLVKLHGSVTDPSIGFVFDKDEYRKFMSQDNWLLMQFGTEYLRRDVIVIGSEFQEDDLLTIIQKFKNIAGGTEDINYFFVSPQIKTRGLRRQIDDNSNFFHIEKTTEQFFELLKAEAPKVGLARKRFRDYGMKFLDELKRESSSCRDESAHLYLGEIPRFQDFFDDWDIRLPFLAKEVNDHVRKNDRAIISLYGDSYVGKSCAAMRVITDYLNLGYVASQFDLTYSMSAANYTFLVEEYLKSLSPDSKVIILSENCTILYNDIRNILHRCPVSIKKLIFVTTANTEDHRSKRYFFDNIPQWLEYRISEKINNKFANNIYEKLTQRNHLNKLSTFGPSRLDIIAQIKNLNDIIDVLYLSQEGRGFLRVYSNWLRGQSAGVYRDAFSLLSFFSRINLETIPSVIFTEIVQNISNEFDFDVFVNLYNNVLRIQDGNIRVRCSRLLNRVLENNLGIECIMKVIIRASQMLARNIQDQELSLKSELYQKILKVKVLLSAGLSKDQVLQIINGVKDVSSHLSYFWIQYGIIYREMAQFEEANCAFREAIHVRGRESYHIQHSQAKNYMEWSIWELNHDAALAPYYFDQGRSQMLDLIEHASARYFSYSIHTYIDMSLRYYLKEDGKLPASEIEYISNLLIQMLSGKGDDYCIDICRKFINECIPSNDSVGLTMLKHRFEASHLDDSVAVPFADIDMISSDSE